MSKITISNQKDIKNFLVELMALLNRDGKFTIRYYKDCCRVLELDIKIEYIDDMYKVWYKDKLVLSNNNKYIVSSYIRSRL